jgi:hypothetical protein
MQKVTEYLFGTYDEEALKQLDFRTIIPSTDIFKTISYYRILQSLGCKNAEKIANIIESLLVSVEGIGRGQGVEILKQKILPKTQYLYQSVEPESASVEGASSE